MVIYKIKLIAGDGQEYFYLVKCEENALVHVLWNNTWNPITSIVELENRKRIIKVIFKRHGYEIYGDVVSNNDYAGIGTNANNTQD